MSQRVVVDEDLRSQLQAFSSPTICNAIEALRVRPFTEGYMDGTIKCRFPGFGSIVGRAATARISAVTKADGRPFADLIDHVVSSVGPTFVVVEDVDKPRGIGSYWGEVNANMHRALGCVGVITNGAVRDLPEMEALGFQAFSASIGVSHAYVHLVEVGNPVTVGGLTVSPGDLLHGDQHGIVHVPDEHLDGILLQAARIEERERRIIELCQSTDFSPDQLKQLFAPVQASST